MNISSTKSWLSSSSLMWSRVNSPQRSNVFQQSLNLPAPSKSYIDTPNEKLLVLPYAPNAFTFGLCSQTGENYAMYLADGSTKENPIILAKGLDSNGEHYELEIPLNQIDPTNASYLEMIALVQYGIKNEVGNFVPDDLCKLLAVRDYDMSCFTKTNYAAQLEEQGLGLSSIKGYERQGRDFLDLLAKLKLFALKNTPASDQITEETILNLVD